ncbi:MAG: alpha/beta hydrolase, partial [Candidatus Omnitrophota bacterium]
VICQNLEKNTLDDLAKTIYQNFSKNSPVHMVTSSFGFMVSLKILELYPESFKSLTAVGTTTAFSCIPKAQILQMKKDLKKNYKEALNKFYTLIFSQSEREEENFNRTITFMCQDLEKYNSETLTSQLEILSTQDFTDILNKLNIPILFIAGQKDPLIPLEVLKNMQQKTNNSRLEIIEKAGHIPFYTKPDIFNKALDNFLK